MAIKFSNPNCSLFPTSLFPAPAPANSIQYYSLCPTYLLVYIREQSKRRSIPSYGGKWFCFLRLPIATTEYKLALLLVQSIKLSMFIYLCCDYPTVFRGELLSKVFYWEEVFPGQLFGTLSALLYQLNYLISSILYILMVITCSASLEDQSPGRHQQVYFTVRDTGERDQVKCEDILTFPSLTMTSHFYEIDKWGNFNSWSTIIIWVLVIFKFKKLVLPSSWSTLDWSSSRSRLSFCWGIILCNWLSQIPLYESSHWSIYDHPYSLS